MIEARGTTAEDGEDRASGWLTELGYFVIAYLVYWTARWVFAGDPNVAYANAAAIWKLEQTTGTNIELSVQRAFDSEIASFVLSNLYLAAQMAVLPIAIVCLYRRSRPVYRTVRTTLIATWMLSVPIFVAFPVAPPRLAELGFTDMVSDQAAVALTGSSTAFYNAFAAVPSLHVGFAFVISIAGVAVVRGRWAKLLAASWGPLVTLTVVATGNHYVFDALAGVAVTAAGSAVGLRRAPRASRPFAGRDDPALVREHDGLHPVAQIELQEHAADVALDGGLADHEVFGDLGVGEAARHELEHFALAGREPVEHLVGRARGRAPACVVLDQPTRHRR